MSPRSSTHLDIALVEWPDGLTEGGPRLLGRTSDPDLVSLVRERLAEVRRLQLEKLTSEGEGEGSVG